MPPAICAFKEIQRIVEWHHTGCTNDRRKEVRSRTSQVQWPLIITFLRSKDENRGRKVLPASPDCDCTTPSFTVGVFKSSKSSEQDASKLFQRQHRSWAECQVTGSLTQFNEVWCQSQILNDANNGSTWRRQSTRARPFCLSLQHQTFFAGDQARHLCARTADCPFSFVPKSQAFRILRRNRMKSTSKSTAEPFLSHPASCHTRRCLILWQDLSSKVL